MLQNGSQWLEGQRHEQLSHEVTYRRGDQSVVLNETDGRTEFEQQTDYGIALQSEARDYLIRAGDLILTEGAAEPVLPRAGDRIDEIHGDMLHTYEVMAPGNEPVYRWSDPDHLTLRIHTKWIGAET